MPWNKKYASGGLPFEKADKQVFEKPRIPSLVCGAFFVQKMVVVVKRLPGVGFVIIMVRKRTLRVDVRPNILVVVGCIFQKPELIFEKKGREMVVRLRTVV